MVRTRRSPSNDEEASMDCTESSSIAEEDSSQDLPPKPVDSMKRTLVIGRGPFEGSSLYTVRHPRLNSGVLFRLGEDVCDEVLLLDDEHRCLFYGDSVVADGRPRIFSPYHPLFLILPYLEKKKSRFETMEEILADEELPAIGLMGTSKRVQEEVEEIAECKEVCDEKLYKLSEEKAKEWVKGRFEILKQQLVENAKLHDGITGNVEVLDRYSFGVLSDYLTTDMASLMKAHLDIKDALKVLESMPDPVGAKRRLDDDENLYSGPEKGPAAKKAPTQTAKQKQLQQASKGTKLLASFFGKKN